MYITASEVNSAGLILDIIGAVMLWRFVTQNPVKEMQDKKGAIVGWKVTEQTLMDTFNVNRKYGRLAQIGITLLVLGFILQLWSNFL